MKRRNILIALFLIITLIMPKTTVRAEEEISGYDIARFAVEYALPERNAQSYANGSALYQKIHDEVFPGDAYYGSCDRSVTTAIVGSGADPDMPPGPCYAIEAHMQESELWNYIGTSLTVEYEDLEPGDIFIIGSYHVFMYVGYDLVKEIHGTVGDTVEGALCFNMSASCYPTTDYTYQQGRVDYNGYGPYSIYRYKKGIVQSKEVSEEVQETVSEEILEEDVLEEVTEETGEIEETEETEEAEEKEDTKVKVALETVTVVPEPAQEVKTKGTEAMEGSEGTEIQTGYVKVQEYSREKILQVLFFMLFP